MAIAYTYNSLVDAIKAYAERTDPSFTDYIPNFIFQAQLRINADLKTLLKETIVTSALTLNNPVFQKPVDWRQTVSFNIGVGVSYQTAIPLQSRTQDFIRLYWPDPTQTAQPIYYSDYGNPNLLLAPTPDADYFVEFTYFGNQQFISEEQQTNAITDYCPNLLLIASLWEANIFTKDAELEAAYEKRYADLIKPLVVEDQMRKQTRFNLSNRD